MSDSIDKVYTPLEVADSPFPVTDPTSLSTTSTSTGNPGVSTPLTTQDIVFPVKPIATDVITAALNTKARKILQSFDLEQHGGLQIGQYAPGVTGDIRITPAGITARDQAGNTTFDIDGDTGDAIFQGTLRAGTLIGGDNKVQIGQGAGGGNIALYDASGNLAIFIGFT